MKGDIGFLLCVLLLAVAFVGFLIGKYSTNAGWIIDCTKTGTHVEVARDAVYKCAPVQEK